MTLPFGVEPGIGWYRSAANAVSVDERPKEKKSMYLTEANQLDILIANRRVSRDQIRRKVNEWVKRKYGVTNYLGLMESHFPFSNDGGKPVAVLARQIASVCVEDITCAVFAEKIGLRQATITFVRDTFTPENHDKKARVKIPWIEWSKKGNIVRTYQKICKGNIGGIHGMILDFIPTNNARTIQEFHSELRAKVFSENLVLPQHDTSRLHSEVFQLSTLRPSYVYEERGGMDVRKSTASIPTEWTDPLKFRPPGSWYYPLYLSWFLTGDMVLLETYENPDGGVPEAKKLFEKAMEEVREATGLLPLVVEILPLTLDLLACNKHVVEGGQKAIEQISTCDFGDKRSLMSLYANISEAVFRFR